MTGTPVLSAERRDIPGLDGLRALSILLVLSAHLVTHSVLWPQLPQLAGLGTLGVEIFFAISGYLITTLLLREWGKKWSIDLSQFYLRRVTRIFPAYYVFLAISAVSVSLGLFSPAGGRWWPAPLYLTNLITTNSLIGHSWSLSVEEQFYLSWPFAISKLGPRRAYVAALLTFVTAPIIRILLFVTTRNNWLASSWNHDFIAAGCMVALLERDILSGGSARLARALQSRFVMLASLVLVALHLILGPSTGLLFGINLSLGLSIEAVSAALIVGWCVRNGTTTTIGGLLENPIVRRIGVLSYSIYLWQQPFLFGYAPIPRWSWLPATLLCAWMSYRFVETPALALRRRLARARRPFSVPVRVAPRDDSP